MPAQHYSVRYIQPRWCGVIPSSLLDCTVTRDYRQHGHIASDRTSVLVTSKVSVIKSDCDGSWSSFRLLINISKYTVAFIEDDLDRLSVSYTLIEHMLAAPSDRVPRMRCINAPTAAEYVFSFMSLTSSQSIVSIARVLIGFGTFACSHSIPFPNILMHTCIADIDLHYKHVLMNLPALNVVNRIGVLHLKLGFDHLVELIQNFNTPSIQKETFLF